MRALPASTQSSFAFDSWPTSKPAPPAADMSASSPRSASVSAVPSLVSTWIAMSRLPPKVLGSPVMRTGDAGGAGPVDTPGTSVILPSPAPVFPLTIETTGAAGPRSERDGVVAERHTQLADHSREVDAVVVGQAQHLALTDVEEHLGLARVLAQEPFQRPDALLAQAQRRQLEAQR